jgi:hypothetical protein
MARPARGDGEEPTAFAGRVAILKTKRKSICLLDGGSPLGEYTGWQGWENRIQALPN